MAGSRETSTTRCGLPTIQGTRHRRWCRMSIKQWVKLRVGSMYENRESLMVGSGNFISELPHSYVDGLLDEFVVQSV